MSDYMAQKMDDQIEYAQRTYAEMCEELDQLKREKVALEDRVTALVDALTSARDYITSELDRERQTFKGHENCSDIPAIERDLAQVDAALRAAGVELP